MGEDGRLSSVGVLTRQWWLMVNARVGVDYEFNPAEVPDGEWPQDSGLRVDLQQMTSDVRSRNAEMHLALTPCGSVSLTITLLDRCQLASFLRGWMYPVDSPCGGHATLSVEMSE